MLSLLACAAFAAEPKVPEATPPVAPVAPAAAPRFDDELVVYGDDFARWDNTRWLVQNELVLPLGATFGSDRNRSFSTYAFQVRSVIKCDKDAKLSKKKWEVSCEVEDVGLLVTSQRRFRSQSDRDFVQEILNELDAKMTGMDVQMQVDQSGGITNLDLEGLSADNQRERELNETLRQVVGRTMSGFHLRIPEHAQRSGQWVEYRSELLDMPSLTASRGSSTLVHQVSPMQGMQLVQTVGEGTTSVNLPIRSREAFSTSLQNVDAPSVLGDKVAGTTNIPPPESGAQTEPSTSTSGESSVELIYSLKASGVALFQKADGIMSERVWLVTGTPTASSAGGTLTAPFRNVGRIQLLGTADKPDVGPTKQVAWPGRIMEGLDPWISVESMPE